MKCAIQLVCEGRYDVFLVGLGTTGCGQRKILQLDFYPEVVVLCPFCKGWTAANNKDENGPCGIVHTDPTCAEWRAVPNDDPATFLAAVNKRLQQDVH